MSEIREAIERIGQAFAPPSNSFERLVQFRKGRRLRHRHRTILALAVLGAVALGGGAVALLPTPPECPPVAEGGYQARVVPAAGPTGSEATISGPVPLFQEDESFAGTDDEIEFWWNADPSNWETLLSFRSGGPDPTPSNSEEDVVRLGSIDPEGQCNFEFEFEVPDASPGDYPIVVLQYGGDGATIYDDARFQLIDQ